jgi:F-type H+-transporting ATPase subunit b
MGTQLVTPELGTIIWTLVTFGILFVLLKQFAWGPLLSLLDEREKTVREALEAAERARAEADETLRKNQEILAGARRETQALLEQGRKESETMRAEILAQARQEALGLVEQGKRQIQFEQKQAFDSLRQQVADLAIGAAERLIRADLDDARHRQLVADYVKNLNESGSETGKH